MALAERSNPRLTPDILLRDMLGHPDALRSLIDPYHPAHTRALLRFQITVTNNFDQEQKGQLTNTLLQGVASESPPWNCESRLGALRLLQKLPLVDIPQAGVQMQKIVRELDPEKMTAGESVASVIQAVHLVAPALTDAMFEEIMDRMEEITAHFGGPEGVAVKKLLQKVVPPDQKAKLKRLRSQFDDPEEIIQRMFPDGSLTEEQVEIMKLKLNKVPMADIAEKLELKYEDVRDFLVKMGLAKGRTSKEEVKKRAERINELTQRNASLQDIAGELGVSTSTVTRRLRLIKGGKEDPKQVMV